MNKIYRAYNFQSVENQLDALEPIAADDGWGNTADDLKVVSTCGRKPEGALTILFSRIAKAKVDILMKKYQNLEWLAYLIGDASNRFVRDIVLPEQEVTSGAVTVTGPQPSSDVMGVIHSHHSMGAFFSGTDDAYINQNYDISVVVAHNGIKAQVRWVTPCGYKVVSDGQVIVESENLFDENDFISQVDTVVTPKTFNLIKSVCGTVTKIPVKHRKGIRGLSGLSGSYMPKVDIDEETSPEHPDEGENLADMLTRDFCNRS